eukprot:scaffold300609_cov31-Attheya_sp.AAC.1
MFGVTNSHPGRIHWSCADAGIANKWSNYFQALLSVSLDVAEIINDPKEATKTVDFFAWSSAMGSGYTRRVPSFSFSSSTLSSLSSSPL